MLGEDKVVKLFRDMVRVNGVSVRKGHTLLANLVVSGEVQFALTLYHYKAEQLKNAGAPLDWYVIPPGFARFLGTGVMRRSPHPHAAVLFLDFMLYEAQQLLLTRDFTPDQHEGAPARRRRSTSSIRRRFSTRATSGPSSTTRSS